MKILVVNVGSTSLKYKAFQFPSQKVLGQGRLERIGSSKCPVTLVGRSGKTRHDTLCLPDYGAAIDTLIENMLDPEEGALHDLKELSAIGFKTVHAGPRSLGKGAKYLDSRMLKAMERANFVAPAHNPPYIDAIRTMRKKLPRTPLVGLFEPAFHYSMPPKAYTYGVPYEWQTKYGIRGYGFHGASHRFISERAPDFLRVPKSKRSTLRLVSCHLGGSCSLCAAVGGRSADTTMSYSPQSGLVHSKRCETIDAFALLHMMKLRSWSPEVMAETLCKNGGLYGISGVSEDMRDLEQAAAEGNNRAKLAIEVFVYQVQKQVGAMAVAAGGLDVLVFTGGIGERGRKVRGAVCEGLGFLGVKLSSPANNRCHGEERVISTPSSRVSVAVIPANEELIVARETARLLRHKRGH